MGGTVSRPRATSKGLPDGVTRHKSSPNLYVAVPHPSGGPSKRISTGLRYLDTMTPTERRETAARAAEMHAFARSLARDVEKRDVLQLVLSGAVSLPAAYARFYRQGPGGLAALVEEQSIDERDLDVTPFASEFGTLTYGLHATRPRRAVTADHRKKTHAALCRFLDFCRTQAGVAQDEPLRLSQITRARLRAYLGELLQRARHAPRAQIKESGLRPQRDCLLAVRQFYRWLREEKEIAWATDPSERMPIPSPKEGRMEYLERADVEVLALAIRRHPAGGELGEAYWRILHATALDTSDVARLRVSDFRPAQRAFRSSSAKSRGRDREAPVLFDVEWIEAFVAGRAAVGGRDALLFGRWGTHARASTEFSRLLLAVTEALAASGEVRFANYQPRDARHTVAVHLARRGVALSIIARQLGTSERVVSERYAKYQPTTDEIERVRQLCAVDA